MSSPSSQPFPDTLDADLWPLWRSSWAMMNSRAWWLLKHSAELDPSLSGRAQPFHGIPRLILWDDAVGFGAERPFTLAVFELYAHDYSRYPVVREAVWRRAEDLRRLHSDMSRTRECAVFEPTISVRDGSVPANELAVMLEEATSFRVPVVWLDGSESLVTDLGSRGFEFVSREQPPSVLRLEWAVETPTTWHPVLDWVARLEAFLLTCFPSKC